MKPINLAMQLINSLASELESMESEVKLLRKEGDELKVRLSYLERELRKRDEFIDKNVAVQDEELKAECDRLKWENELLRRELDKAVVARESLAKENWELSVRYSQKIEALKAELKSMESANSLVHSMID